MIDKKFNRLIAAGIILGILFGLLAAFEVIAPKYLGINWISLSAMAGEVFMLLLKWVVVPMVFLSVVVGILSLKDTAHVGKLGRNAVIYYLSTSIVASIIGLILVNIFQPGVGLTLGEGVVASQEGADATVLGMIQDQVRSVLINPFEALSKGTGAMLAIIFTAIFLGIGLISVENQNKFKLFEMIEVLNDTFFKMTMFILKVAPYGIFGIIASTLYERRDSLGVLTESLSWFTLTCVLGLFIHGCIVLPLLLKFFTNWKLRDFFRGIRGALEVAFGTDSSMATLPVTLKCTQENLNLSKKTTDFMLPLGATVNMDGSALYEAVAALFIAQALGMELNFLQQIIVFITATIASIGAAGIPSAGLVSLLLVTNAVGIPYDQAVPYIGMIYAIDRFIDVLRTVVNVEGDCVGAAILDQMDD